MNYPFKSYCQLCRSNKRSQICPHLILSWLHKQALLCSQIQFATEMMQQLHQHWFSKINYRSCSDSSWKLIPYKRSTQIFSTAQCCCVPDHLCRQPSDDCYFLLPGDADRPLCILTFTLEPGFMERMWNISVYIRQWICECWKTMHKPLTIATKPCPYSFDSHKIGTAFLEPFLWFLGARFVPLWPAGISWLHNICGCL